MVGALLLSLTTLEPVRAQTAKAPRASVYPVSRKLLEQTTWSARPETSWELDARPSRGGICALGWSSQSNGPLG